MKSSLIAILSTLLLVGLFGGLFDPRSRELSILVLEVVGGAFAVILLFEVVASIVGVTNGFGSKHDPGVSDVHR